MVKDHSDSERGIPLQVGLLQASSHRQEITYHGLCYTSRGALAGLRNNSMGAPRRIDPTTNERMLLPRSYTLLRNYICLLRMSWER